MKSLTTGVAMFKDFFTPSSHYQPRQFSRFPPARFSALFYHLSTLGTLSTGARWARYLLEYSDLFTHRPLLFC